MHFSKKKTMRFLYAFAASLCLVSCFKDKPYMTELSFPNIPVIPAKEKNYSDGQEVTIHATLEGGDDTKTTYTEDTGTMRAYVGWEVNDKISILYSNGSTYYKQEFTTTAGDGSFTGTAVYNEGGLYAYWAIYPYNICYYVSAEPSWENTRINLPTSYEGSGADGIPMCAYSSKSHSWDGTYHFKHMGAVLRFKCTNIPNDARYLVIENDENDIAGHYYTVFDSANDIVYYTTPTDDDGSQKSVTYHFTPSDGVFTFYLPYGVDYPDGNFTFTFKKGDGTVLRYKQTTLGSLAITQLVRNYMYRININANDGFTIP